MKFVCDRCQTRYSIADEKVRRKILRIRCKTCGNVIVVQDEAAGFAGAGPTVVDPHAAEAVMAALSSEAKAASSSGPKAVPSSGPKAVPSSGPKAVPSSAPKAVPSSGPKAVPTSGPKAVPSSGPKAAPPVPPRHGAGVPSRAGKGGDPLGGHVEWYVAVDGVQSGPYSRVEAAKRIMGAGHGKEIHVWKEGMAGWKPPTEVSVIARELSLLRPAPPPPPRGASRTPPPVDAPAPAAKHAAKGEGATPPPAPAPPALQSAADTFAALADKGVPDGDMFGDITTKRTQGFRDLADKPPGGGFAEVTTRKGKNLRDLETESLYTPEPNLGEGEVTPPPAQPLPPVGTKVPAGPPKAPPFFAPALRTVTPPPAHAVAPAAPRAVPFVAPAASPVPPTVPFSTPPASPVPPPGLFSAPAVTPLSPLSAPVTPVAPMAAEPSASGPVFSGGMPTSQPVSVAPFGDVLAEPAPAMLLRKPGLAGLLERQPGLKYVFAAVAIVGLILLLVLVVLRGERQKPDEPTPAASPEPAKVEEPSKVEEPKAAPAEIPPPPTPPTPPKVEEPKPAPSAPGPPPPAGRRGAKRGGRHAAAERSPKEKPAANPPRLAGARPNPFDEAKAVSQSQITAVVRNPANQAALKSCYERALKMDNHLTSGRMDVTVSISAGGVVQRVVVNAPSNFIMVEPCIKSAVKRWSFPSNTEEYGTTFPLIMQGGM
jgi:predicted Zn finger-like uncharacterized protein